MKHAILVLICMTGLAQERAIQRFTFNQHMLYRECCRIRERLLTANHGIFSCDYFLNSAVSLYLRLQGTKEADDLLHYFEHNNFTFPS